MPEPRRILIFQNRFRIGGQERQTVLNVRSMDRARFEPVVAVLHLDGDHLQDLEVAGVRPVVFDVGGRMIRPNTAWQLARIVRFVHTERIAVIHAQDVYTNVLGVLAARLARVPVILTRVDLGHHLEGYRRPLLQAASRVADRVLVNALCIRDLAVREGVEADRVAVVRNGVDLEALDLEARRAPDHPVPEPGAVVCIANMHHPVKGQSDLLVAMREVLRTRPDARLVLVGEGVRRPLLERLARRLGISDRCYFLGHRLDAPALLAQAVAGVSASYAEGISNAILESMAMRLPVVATRVGGTPEVVREGQNGFLVPPGAPAALARRILDLLRDPALRRRMGERGRRIVEEEFGLAQMRLSYDALYQELTEDPSPRIVAGLG
ncbi:glycosyl transferase group 1 [Anaeromyxobacter dehalogenans 2CP-1]|uniref:Glycosyl transferase group 1 n=1 Tax=Anaeromyxobacter dehalogenans (strain ATCC BAA-258 / DSM 21875 / 2CP-1) TaxID=455488 RepID=B8JE92_ANAD2|nr:glycosyltransferase [Anaeromyxobacter dehalogenans]ACL66157.1 glycosyl transferase group 1 [Anaeromyxobacter dehalogenans 2CP-1]